VAVFVRMRAGWGREIESEIQGLETMKFPKQGGTGTGEERREGMRLTQITGVACAMREADKPRHSWGITRENLCNRKPCQASASAGNRERVGNKRC
jgi:hypothetical protein